MYINSLNIEEFEYIHIFNLLKDIFKFNEKKYGDYVKDTLKILLEFEKNGETIIDVDKIAIFFDLLKDGWPNEHLRVLNYLGLINFSNSPFVFADRKLSLAKWSGKIDRVIKKPIITPHKPCIGTAEKALTNDISIRDVSFEKYSM